MAVKYGIKNGKIVKIYPHKISKKIGKHNHYVLWKTTRKNLPRKTYHGKFYNSKKNAEKRIKKTLKNKSVKKTKKYLQKGGRWYDTTSPEQVSNTKITPLGYSAIREIAFAKKYIFNPPVQGK